MKKMLIISILISSFLVINATMIKVKNQVIDSNIKFIYISYLEYLSNFKGNNIAINKNNIDKMIDNVVYYKFNTIILHVSPFSDAIYKSKIFPYSYTLTGVEGKNPGFDYLEYFIKKAHSKKINIYAWINPYRISNSNNIEKLSQNNPARTFLNSENIKISDKGIYYDPTSELVKELIVNQVKEIIENYDVDGIHFDDYFYTDKTIDNYEYDLYLKNGGDLSKKDYRLSNTNDLIKRVHDKINIINNKIIFSIAPDGNINNNYELHYADVKKWINDEYIDIIMPQIYYGFNNEYLPFDKAYNNWINLIGNKSVKIIPVLSFYKVGYIDKNAGNGANEWLSNGVIEKQIKYLKDKNNYNGYGLFRYDYLFNNILINDISKKELKNIQNIM